MPIPRHIDRADRRTTRGSSPPRLRARPPRRTVKVGSERANTGILIAESKTRLPLVRRDEIKILEVDNVAPTARYLTVGHPEAGRGQCLHEFGYRPPIEYSVAKIRQYDGLGRHRLHGFHDLRENLVGYGTIIERVDFQQAIITNHDRILADGGPRFIHHRMYIDADLLEPRDDEVTVTIVPEHG